MSIYSGRTVDLPGQLYLFFPHSTQWWRTCTLYQTLQVYSPLEPKNQMWLTVSHRIKNEIVPKSQTFLVAIQGLSSLKDYSTIQILSAAC